MVEEFGKVDKVKISLDTVTRGGAVVVFHAAEGREMAVGSCRVVFLLGGREGVIAAAVAEKTEQELIGVGALEVGGHVSQSVLDSSMKVKQREKNRRLTDV